MEELSREEMLTAEFEKAKKNKKACSDENGNILPKYKKAFEKLEASVKADAQRYFVDSATAYLCYLKDGRYVPYVDIEALKAASKNFMVEVRKAISSYDDKALFALCEKVRDLYMDLAWNKFKAVCASAQAA